MAKKKRTTVIEIYPACPKPKWLKVGAVVEVLGEGRGCPFVITAVEGNRAAVIAKEYYTKGHPGGCWESFTKIYRHDDGTIDTLAERWISLMAMKPYIDPCLEASEYFPAVRDEKDNVIPGERREHGLYFARKPHFARLAA
jgi:hypothetical protein